MGLLELVKKQINITSDENLKIEYMKANDIYDILKFLKEDFEDFILVKRDLVLNETDLISCYKGIVFTTKPKTLNSFDAVKKLEENKNIKVVELKNIGLNFISCGEILYAFSEIQPDSEFPNVLKIYPVHKKIFEENISAQNNNNNINIEISDNAITKKFNHKTNIQTAIQNENHEIESREKREKKLILKELFRIFNEEFTVVRIEFWGDIEDKKIGLTRFYNCHGISKGRLMGSWKLFDKDQLNTILDKGLKKKIIDALSKEFSISLGVSYGKIIHNKDKEDFKKRAEDIEKDYLDYLRGINKNNTIGNIKIRVAFNPEEAVNSSRNQLSKYLKGLKPNISEFERIKYNYDVDKFVKEAFADIDTNDFASKVILKKIFTNFTEDQWEDDNFIEVIKDACGNEKNRKFFSEEFSAKFNQLIKRLDYKNKNSNKHS